MKLTIDTEKKTILIDEEMVLGQLMTVIQELSPTDWTEWKLIPSQSPVIKWVPNDPAPYPTYPNYPPQTITPSPIFPQPGTIPFTPWCTTTITNNKDVPYTETGKQN